MHRVALLVAALIATAPVGCGGSARLATASPRGELGVRLSLRQTSGERLELTSLRGAPVLLFVFATWDSVSQAMLNPLRTLAEAHPDLRIVAIGAQPDAASLLPLWERALEPPFTVAYDPQGRLAGGNTELGEIEAIPLVILLNRRGQVSRRHVGFADQRTLETMLRRLRD